MPARLPRLSLSRTWLAALACAGVLSMSSGSPAALWPDVPDRVKADLASKDVARRRSAAADLVNLTKADATPLVKTALVDPDVEVRLTAASAAARLGVHEIADLLLPWLTDADARLREGACEFFAKSPDPKLVKVISRSLGDTEPRVRLAAVRALGASASPDAVAPLLARLDDSNSKVRLAVARALARLGDKRAVTPLVSKVQDEASEVRQAVVRTLGDLGDPKASPALVIALKDTALEVRIEALSALARLHAADAVASIAPLAVDPTKKQGSTDVRRAALAALGRIATPAAVDGIVRAFGLFEDEKPGVGSSPAREAAVTAGAAAVPALTAIVEGTGTGVSASPGAIASAAWALGEIQAKGAGVVLEKGIRRGAVPLAVGLHALAALGDPAQLPICLEYVASPDRGVRTEALLAAARLLDPEQPDGRAVEPLLSSLDLAQTPEDRAEIATLLGRTGALRAAPILVGLTAAKDDRLRIAAIDALGTLGVAAGGPALAKLLDDPLASVRLHAAIALGRSGGADVLPSVLARLTAAQADRLAVVVALGGLLERHGDAASIAKARDALAGLGSERDLLVVAIGRAKGSASTIAALRSSTLVDVDGRRAAAVALGAHAGDAAAISPLVALAADVDASVRAQAAWSLGAVGGAGELDLVAKLARDPSAVTAANGAAAIGRILLRLPKSSAPATLCTALDDERPYVRANALASIAGLVAAGRPACDEARPRKMLEGDGNDVVRIAAARSLGARLRANGDAAARSALERCTLADPSGSVAAVCREALLPNTSPATTTTSSLVVFVAPDDGGAPEPRAAYAVERPDGFLHVGTADARGAVVETFLGRGTVRLRVATP